MDVSAYRRRRDLMAAVLEDAGYEFTLPEGAFYLIPKAPMEDDLAFIRALQAKRILTDPGRGFGKPGYFRIAYCVARRVIEGALPGFREVAEEYGLRPSDA